MQGQIIDAAVASNQGMILGDDGARYTFNSGGWRDASVKAVAGMRVEFSPQGPMAMEVVVIRAAPQPVPAPPPPAPAPAYPVAPQPTPQLPPTPARQPSYPPRASQIPQQPRPAANFVPTWPKAKDNKTAMGILLIFLGPFASFIFMLLGWMKPSDYVRQLLSQIVVLAATVVYIAIALSASIDDLEAFAVGGVIIMLGYLLYGLSFVIKGIVLLAKSEEDFNRERHYYHDHLFQNEAPGYCLTSVCRSMGVPAVNQYTRR